MKLNKTTRDAGNALLEADHAAQERLRPFARTRAAGVLDPVSKLADQPQLRLLSAALLLAGLLKRDRKLTNAGARMILAHEAATFAKDMLKTEIDRTRPRTATSKKERKPKKGDHEAKELTSFPSGHSAGAIAVARAFSREYPEYAAAALGGATILGLVQIARCAHYPTDVAAGFSLGLAAEKATDVAWKATGADRSDEQEA